MKTLYLDIFSGISGDMFIGALIDLGVDARRLERELKKLKLEGWHLHVARGEKMGISGVKFDVQDLTHDHIHTHGTLKHSHQHSHSQPHDHEHEGHCHDHEHDHGAHGGPLVAAGKQQIELSVFETNVPPRFRLYFFDESGKPARPLAASAVTLETVRAKGKRQVFKFQLRGNFLEADDELAEPHEFKAVLKVRQSGRTQSCETEFIEAHHHHHGHDHSRNFGEIKQLISESALSAWVKQKSVAVFHRIALAEGKIHGLPPEQVHFHEVGAVDSIVDIVGACIALEMLGKPRVLASPVVEGTGWINCAHGRFPIPAPATLAILGARGIGVTQCEEPHELVTPTGAALLAEFAEGFGPMSGLVAEKIGFGLGTRDNQTRPNVLRAVFGKVSGAKGQLPGKPTRGTFNIQHSTSNAQGCDWEVDRVAVLETNLDDIKAEILGHFVEQALAAGALDVFHTPIQMKKNRPGVLLTVLCAETESDKFSEMILRETSAFGVRRTVAERRKLRREVVTVKTKFGNVAVKVGRLNGKVVQSAPEFESCKRLAAQKKVPLKQIYEAVRSLK